MNTCRITGSAALAVSPKVPLLTGTLRQPRKVCPSSRTIRSNSASHRCRCSRMGGRKTRPDPYCFSSGSRIFASSHAWRKKRCGICTRIPAPSPVLFSQPQAPRCRRLTRMVMASRTIARDLRPLTLTTNPTPQASCSYRGSYRPCLTGGPVCCGLPPSPCRSVLVAILGRSESPVTFGLYFNRLYSKPAHLQSFRLGILARDGSADLPVASLWQGHVSLRGLWARFREFTGSRTMPILRACDGTTENTRGGWHERRSRFLRYGCAFARARLRGRGHHAQALAAGLRLSRRG